MKIVKKISNILEDLDFYSNVETEYSSIDDTRIHVYYDEDGWVWDAIEGEYIIGTSEDVFETAEEAEEDAKLFLMERSVEGEE